jgi:hemoglobin
VIRGYIDWAVQTVAESHPHDTDVPAGLPLPHWSWDGLQASQASQASGA